MITIYTDGACHPNPGDGGWAAIIMLNGITTELTGSEPNTTNNRMELMAAIKALEHFEQSQEITLYTDSIYVQMGITTWIYAWELKGFRHKRGKIVSNVDLWKRLLVQQKLHKVDWKWVRGHSGDHYNNLVDRLAQDARRKIGSHGELEALIKDQRRDAYQTRRRTR